MIVHLLALVRVRVSGRARCHTRQSAPTKRPVHVYVL
jgi:hypothetical protein